MPCPSHAAPSVFLTQLLLLDADIAHLLCVQYQDLATAASAAQQGDEEVLIMQAEATHAKKSAGSKHLIIQMTYLFIKLFSVSLCSNHLNQDDTV